MLGIVLDEMDVLNIALLATDLYGNLLLGANGFAQIVTAGGREKTACPRLSEGQLKFKIFITAIFLSLSVSGHQILR